jgi:NADPH-dependent 2,4-dienoyl-CoA reductase/sulfur reductase-like enzyme
MAWIKDCPACRAVVVGGGYIGLEMAEQLNPSSSRLRSKID